MARDLSRLLQPKSIALFGGGWAENVVAQLQKSGFAGDIWPVHPTRKEMLGVSCFASIEDLPSAPDASFIGVNRNATIDVVQTLSKIGAGGATCFASGYSESDDEAKGGADLQAKLVAAAGDMPIIGPNCYGLLNYLDNVTLWPDQHGGIPCARGVGIIAQSSNIAINMTMQRRRLPIAYVVAAGNQAQTGIAELGEAMLADTRVSVIGLYLEGFGDIRALETFAARAKDLGKPVVVLKIGRSEKAQLATLTHTASLAGHASVSSALIKRLGFIEVSSITTFLETLKMFDAFGLLEGSRICSVSCSGGEASLISDLASADLTFSDFSHDKELALRQELGPLVTITNPLDYHTFIWGDVLKMTRVFSLVMADQFDLCVFVLDLPRADRCDPSSFQCAIDAIIAAKKSTNANVVVLSCLQENLSEAVIAHFADNDVVCLTGMDSGLEAIRSIATQRNGPSVFEPVIIAQENGLEPVTLDEAQSKKMLGNHGVNFPKSTVFTKLENLSGYDGDFRFPVVLKGLGFAHKSEARAVVLGIKNRDALILEASRLSGAQGFLVEEFVDDSLVEILVGVTRDATGLLMLTIGAGGVLAELINDTANLLLPATRDEILNALEGLKIFKLLQGHRGKLAGDLEGLVDQILKTAEFAVAHKDELIELDVNPILVCVDRCVAVDALIRLQKEGMPHE